MALNPDRVLKPVRKLRKLLKKLPKHPTPEQVHDLRTNTRRMEAMLAALSPESMRRQKKLLKDMARVRKKAGKVRDMDVLTDYAASVKTDGEAECRLQLLEHLGATRRDDARKLHVVVVKRADTARKGLKQTAAELEKILCTDGSDNCDPVAAPAQATATALKLESKLFEPPRLTRSNLHPYRLKVKELHNVLRMGENSDSQEFVDALNNVKDAIGEWHDWEELLAIAKEVLHHGNCKLIRELKSISNKKYEQALAEAENLRKKYLGISPGKRSSKAKFPPEPAWRATTALVA